MNLKEITSPHYLECVRIYNATTTWDDKDILSLPDVSFGLRTQADIRIIKKMLSENISIKILSPYASRLQKIRNSLVNILNEKSVGKKPLIIPDIESEAFSFNCIARLEYNNLQPPSVVKQLLNTSLSGSSGIKYTTAWRNAQSNLRPLYIFTAEAQRRVGSHIYFTPTPLIRGDSATVKLAFEISKQLLDQGLKFDPRSPAFSEWGVSFLIHSDFFGNDIENEAARNTFMEYLQNLITMDDLPDHLSVSIKFYDDKIYSSTETNAASRRMNCSHFIGETSLTLEDIRTNRKNGIGGPLIFHNAHPGLLVGFFDSGINICAVRLSGPPIIDVPRRGKKGKRGKRVVSAMWDHEKLTDQPLDTIKQSYIKNGGFSVPHNTKPLPFWELTSRQQFDYYNQVRAKSCIEVVNEIKKVMVNPESPYRDELRDRVHNSSESQILLDMCPTLKN